MHILQSPWQGMLLRPFARYNSFAFVCGTGSHVVQEKCDTPYQYFLRNIRCVFVMGVHGCRP